MSQNSIYSAELMDDKLDKLVNKYSNLRNPLHVSFREMVSELSWAKRSDVYTHQIHSYPGKLLAYIPITFLSSSLIKRHELVLDPFMGTGTVLLESMINPIAPRNAIGVEINPLARLIAKVKTTPINHVALNIVSSILVENIKRKKNAPLHSFSNINFWFRNKAIDQLSKIKSCIEELDESNDIKDFFWVCFSSIIRDMSRADPYIAPPVLFNYHKFKGDRKNEMFAFYKKKQSNDAYILFDKKIKSNIIRMSEFYNSTVGLNNIASNIVWDDARDIKYGRYTYKGELDKDVATSLENKVGSIITSPPYMAAQKYIRSTKLELCWLGLKHDNQIAELDKQSIGRERSNISESIELTEIKNKTALKLLNEISKISVTKAQIAALYFYEMTEVLHTLNKVLMKDGILVMVIGNNEACGKIFPNHKIFTEIAEETGLFSTKVVLRDTIKSRGMITKRHKTGGLIDDEFVMVFQKL